MRKIAIFASGEGSNAENIYQFFQKGNRVRVALIIYDREESGIARRVKEMTGVRAVYIAPEDWTSAPQRILDLLADEEIELIALAGFLRMVPQAITHAYAGRILNIHPSLLPAYGGKGMYGMNVHRAVIEAAEAKSGATVHYVSDELDGGDILMAQEVDVTPDDTPESLCAKVRLAEFELYPRAIAMALLRIPPRINVDPAASAATAEAESASQEPTPAPAQTETAIPRAADVNPPAIPGLTPPATPAEEWAQTLGVRYDAGKVKDALGANPDVEQEAPGVTIVEIDGTPRATSPAGAPRDSDATDREMPPTYLAWSIVVTLLCCIPAGIVAIIYSSQVSSKFYADDLAGARRASERAQIWIIVSFVTGVLFQSLYLPVALLFN
ncbi:MAG: CD225/dispanin family protein [Muribaculaceae bacterium]|nr:CD225/dispanin family protein [Muribaculaceae bacterium]